MIEKTIYNSIIKKPWGEEYCIFRGFNLSIWLLKINPDQKTSLHCHPIKKTGLILLDGDVQINLIERSFPLNGFKKLIFRNGMFHQTHNVSSKPIYLIEVETPDNKYDLIRIEDSYGRKNKKFESQENWDIITDNIFEINSNGSTSKHLNFNFKTTTLESILDDNTLSDDSVIVILGQCGFLSEDEQKLCDYGEVITLKILRFFDNIFKTNLKDKAILIWKS